MKIIDIGKDFSIDPAGRYYTDGLGNGEEFREKLLWPIINSLEDQELLIVLDNNVESYGSSFLSEGFAGIVKYGYMKSESLLKVLQFKYENPDFSFYENKIKQYIKQASFNSEKYRPTKNV